MWMFRRQSAALEQCTRDLEAINAANRQTVENLKQASLAIRAITEALRPLAKDTPHAR